MKKKLVIAGLATGVIAAVSTVEFLLRKKEKVNMSKLLKKLLTIV